eukprot:1824-Chlamydomonas_euryale.AAC.3
MVSRMTGSARGWPVGRWVRWSVGWCIMCVGGRSVGEFDGQSDGGPVGQRLGRLSDCSSGGHDTAKPTPRQL